MRRRALEERRRHRDYGDNLNSTFSRHGNKCNVEERRSVVFLGAGDSCCTHPSSSKFHLNNFLKCADSSLHCAANSKQEMERFTYACVRFRFSLSIPLSLSFNDDHTPPLVFKVLFVLRHSDAYF